MIVSCVFSDVDVMKLTLNTETVTPVQNLTRISRILRQARESQNALLKLQKNAAKIREMLIMHTFRAYIRFQTQFGVQKEDALLHLSSPGCTSPCTSPD